jgi:anti-sigma factor RsiW
MNCHEIEELFPRYLDGEVSVGEREEIERHAAACAQCRESLAAFGALERSLAGLRNATPPWERAQARFAERTGLGRTRSIAAFVFDAPFLCGLAFVALGIVLFIRRELLVSGMQVMGVRLADSLNWVSQSLSASLSGLASLDTAVLLSISVVLTALPLVAFGFAVQRFGRN